MDYLQEKELLQKAKRGDKESIAAIYDMHYQAIYRYIYYRVSDSAAAEDLAADVFIRMLDKLPDYQDRGKPFLAWLYTISRNIVIDYHRSQSKTELIPIQEQIITDDLPGPSKQIEDRQVEDCFRKALERIPESQRLILIYRFIEKHPTPKILELTGKSDRAIRSLQHRSLRSMEKALREENCL